MLDATLWEEIGTLVEELVEAVVAPYAVTAEVRYTQGVPPVVNAAPSVDSLRDAAYAAGLVPGTTVQSLGGEDFAWYLTEVRGAMGRLGTRSPGGPTYDLHQGDLAIDERRSVWGQKSWSGRFWTPDGATRRPCSTFRLGNVPHPLKHFRPGAPRGGGILLHRTRGPYARSPRSLKRSSCCASGDEVRGGHVGRCRGLGRVWEQLERRRHGWWGRRDHGPGGAGLKVGMAYDVGGRGDQSFNDAAAAGLDKAVKELGVQSKEAAATNGEAESARAERCSS